MCHTYSLITSIQLPDVSRYHLCHVTQKTKLGKMMPGTSHSTHLPSLPHSEAWLVWLSSSQGAFNIRLYPTLDSTDSYICCAWHCSKCFKSLTSLIGWNTLHLTDLRELTALLRSPACVWVGTWALSHHVLLLTGCDSKPSPSQEAASSFPLCNKY